MNECRPSAVRGTCNQGPAAGSPNFFFDLRGNVFFRRNAENIAYAVTNVQLPALMGIAVIDVFLSKGHIREPHWHTNANELDVIVSGEVIISVLDPGVPQLLTYHVGPGQSVFIPVGFWHWITATADETHFLTILSNEAPGTVEGSNMLRLTPPEVFQLAYGVNAEEIAEALAPINQAVVIGPPSPMPCETEGDLESKHSFAHTDRDKDTGRDRDKKRHQGKGRQGKHSRRGR